MKLFQQLFHGGPDEKVALVYVGPKGHLKYTSFKKFIFKRASLPRKGHHQSEFGCVCKYPLYPPPGGAGPEVK